MRRKELEVTDPEKIREILGECDCCRLGMKEEDGVYIVPINFGFEETDGQLRLYFHSGPVGKKAELLRKDPAVGFELDCRHQLVPGEVAGDCTFGYQSIIGKGTIRFLESTEEKLHGLRLLMRQYTHKDEWEFPLPLVERTTVFCLTVTQLSCKSREL